MHGNRRRLYLPDGSGLHHGRHRLLQPSQRPDVAKGILGRKRSNELYILSACNGADILSPVEGKSALGGPDNVHFGQNRIHLEGFRIFSPKFRRGCFLYYLCSLEIVPLILTYLAALQLCNL